MAYVALGIIALAFVYLIYDLAKLITKHNVLRRIEQIEQRIAIPAFEELIPGDETAFLYTGRHDMFYTELEYFLSRRHMSVTRIMRMLWCGTVVFVKEDDTERSWSQ